MWAGANLGNLGRMGDAELMASCVPWATDLNPDRVICGGIAFAEKAYAGAWPGAALIEDYPTVHSVAQGHQLYPPNMFAPASRKMSLQDAVGGASGAPATSALEAKILGTDLGPVSLVAPLPSITPVRQGQTSNEGMGIGCVVNSFVSHNPGLAVAGLFLLFVALKGAKR